MSGLSAVAREAERDDSRMDRFERTGARCFRARDGIKALLITALVLLFTVGPSVRRAGEQLHPGPERSLLLAVGAPAAWLGDHAPFHRLTTQLTASLSPDAALGSAGGFGATATAAGGIPVVTPAAFDPSMLGAAPAPRRPLHTLLVTGDSLSTPLDLELARRLADRGVHVLRDPHLGTGISKTDLVDWGKLSASQVAHDHPDAVIVFIGANEGFPMPGPGGKPVQCCGARWAAVYANRVRQVMNTYRRAGAARVYWLTVPTPRDPARAKIERVVNAAVTVGAEAWASQVRVIDTVRIFTPRDRYRDSMPIGGVQTIVRESDGIHLNRAGAAFYAGLLLPDLARDFRF